MVVPKIPALGKMRPDKQKLESRLRCIVRPRQEQKTEREKGRDGRMKERDRQTDPLEA